MVPFCVNGKQWLHFASSDPMAVARSTASRTHDVSCQVVGVKAVLRVSTAGDSASPPFMHIIFYATSAGQSQCEAGTPFPGPPFQMVWGRVVGPSADVATHTR